MTQSGVKSQGLHSKIHANFPFSTSRYINMVNWPIYFLFRLCKIENKIQNSRFKQVYYCIEIPKEMI